VAALLGCGAGAIVFTSGASEANNTVLKGVAAHHGRGRIITAATEHPAVLAPCRYLQSQGFQITILPVDSAGRLDPDEVRRALTPDTILISVMHANNETGTIQPIGKIPVNVDELQVDFLTMAGHKFYAPKGVGALYVRPGSAFTPLLHGASQEGGRRAGTENVPCMVALGEACRLAKERLPGVAAHLQGLRDRLHDLLKAGVPGLILNGPEVERLPNTLNVSFPGLAGCDLMAGVPELAASLGSACHAGQEAVSPVLAAMAVPAAVARGAVRFSVGYPTTPDEVDTAAARLLERVEALTRH
jgi:cysteine desulfurase